MSEQHVLITQNHLNHAQDLLNNGQLSEMYHYLASDGYQPGRGNSINSIAIRAMAA